MILCSAWHKLLCLYLNSRFKSTLGLMLICCLCIYIPTVNKIYLLTYHGLEASPVSLTTPTHRHLFHSKNICPLLFLTSR
jgi:hypothetical protein